MSANLGIATKKGGQTAASGPNMVKTQVGPSTVPLPYPSLGKLETAKGTISDVLIERKPTVVTGSKLPKSDGDKPGKAGGVVSGVNSGEVAFKQGSAKVIIKGDRAVLHMGAVDSNKGNVPGTVVQVKNSKVLASP